MGVYLEIRFLQKSRIFNLIGILRLVTCLEFKWLLPNSRFTIAGGGFFIMGVQLLILSS